MSTAPFAASAENVTPTPALSPPRPKHTRTSSNTPTRSSYDKNVDEYVVKRRAGLVLGKYTILKTDHIPGALLTSLTPRVSGAVNYRKAGSCNVFSVAQPSTLQMVGSRADVEHDGDICKRKRLVWCSLREEPVVYVNGRPFVPRHVERPFSNFSQFQGIDAERIDRMEEQLKNDILSEAHRFRSLILVHDEVEPGVLVSSWEYIQPESVLTMRDIFARLSQDGFLVDYLRCPLQPEAPPQKHSVAELVSLARSVLDDPSAALIFNCQSGRGRSTYGMVVATLVWKSLQEWKLGAKTELSPADQKQESVAEKFAREMRGDFRVILSLRRTFARGEESQKVVNEAIDHCAHVQNLRSHILALKMQSHQSNDEEKRHMFLSQSTWALQRYFLLICLQEYIAETVDKEKPVPFQEWFAARMELRRMYASVKDPSQAFFRLGDDIVDTKHKKLIEIVNKRSGIVLSAHSILKVDRYSTKGGSKAHGDLPPNFFSHPKYTTDELKSLAVSFEADPLAAEKKPFCIANVRVEPMVFIFGIPYVLRFYDRPTEQLRDYAGMTVDRLEVLEERLKRDIIDESERNKGRVIIHTELDSSLIVPSWLRISPDSVKTPLEIASEFVKNEYALTYVRHPIADFHLEKHQLNDLLTLVNTNKDAPIVFVSGSGTLRSVVGLVIGALIRFRQARPSLPAPSSTRGYFRVIKTLLQVLPNGIENKNAVDYVIDSVNARLNLREEIYALYAKYVNGSENDDEALSSLAQSHENFASRTSTPTITQAINLLELYYVLIVFSSYLSTDTSMPFEQWYNEHTVFTNILEELHKTPETIFKDSDLIEHPKPKSSVTVFMNDFESIIRSRHGLVLQSNFSLKSDHFPGCHKEWIPYVEGAPNYRKVDGVPIFGVGIPTETGLQYVLSDLKKSFNKIYWINLREEPLLYINGAPYVLREDSHLFRQLEYSGISGDTVERMESSLKEDVVEEAKFYHGNFLLVREDGSGKPEEPTEIVRYWEHVGEQSVKTARQTYMDVAARVGIRLSFKRVPVTDEKVFEVDDFDEVCAIMRRAFAVEKTDDYAFVFNCQMGQGRTTSGMVVATVLWQLKDPNFLEAPEVSSSSKLQRSLSFSSYTSILQFGATHEALVDDVSASHRRGEYQLINDFIRVTAGAHAKTRLDLAIDKCGAVQNLREAIHAMHVMSETKPHYAQRALNFLERYFYLLAFCTFIEEERAKSEPFTITFKQWMKERPELRTMLSHIELR